MPTRINATPATFYYGMAVGLDGALYFSTADKLMKISSDGTASQVLSSGYHLVVVDGSGNFYLHDGHLHFVSGVPGSSSMFDHQDITPTDPNNGTGDPGEVRGIAVGSNGDVYTLSLLGGTGVQDQDSGLWSFPPAVIKYSAADVTTDGGEITGTKVFELPMGSSVAFPVHMLFDLSGNLLILTSNCRYKITPGGTVTSVITAASSMDMDSDGNLWTGDYVGIHKILPNGSTTLIAALQSLHNVVVGYGGSVYCMGGLGVYQLVSSETGTTANPTHGGVGGTIVFTAVDPTITFTVPDLIYGHAPFAVNATSNSAGAFTYTVTGGNATVSGNIVTLTGSGDVTLHAAQAAATGYTAGTKNVTFAVTDAPAPVYSDVKGTFDVPSGGLKFQAGSNPRVGSGTLVAGACTINNTTISPSSQIFLQTKGTGSNVGSLYVSAKVPAVSFTVHSTNSSDTSDFEYFIIELV